jgi:hypothetical protein
MHAVVEVEAVDIDDQPGEVAPRDRRPSCAGTWVSAGLSAAILVWLAVRSEKQAKVQEATRQAREEDEAMRRERAVANQVACDAYPTGGHSEGGVVISATGIVLTVNDHTGVVVNKLTCDVPFGGIGSVDLADAVTPDDGPVKREFPAREPIEFTRGGREVRESVVFAFSLNGVPWSRCPAATEAIRKELTVASG